MLESGADPNFFCPESGKPAWYGMKYLDIHMWRLFRDYGADFTLLHKGNELYGHCAHMLSYPEGLAKTADITEKFLMMLRAGVDVWRKTYCGRSIVDGVRGMDKIDLPSYRKVQDSFWEALTEYTYDSITIKEAA